MSSTTIKIWQLIRLELEQF